MLILVAGALAPVRRSLRTPMIHQKDMNTREMAPPRPPTAPTDLAGEQFWPSSASMSSGGEYRQIKRPFPPIARTHPVAHPAPPGATPRRASRGSGGPALDAAGRPLARAAGHGQDGWLVPGSLRCWGCPAWGCSGKELKRPAWGCSGGTVVQRETGAKACGRAGRCQGEGCCTKGAAGRAGGR